MLVTKKELKVLQKKYRLSPRELEVIQLLFKGIDSNKEIAEKMGITVGTTKAYVHSILIKVGVESKLKAVIRMADTKQSIYKKR